MAKKILIIDDDHNIVQYLEDIFKDNGYETCIAKDGLEASEVFNQEKPDLITLDLEMPEEWGPKFYRKLTKNAEYADIPVVVISGLPASKYAIKRAVASLDKPFNKEELLKIVKDAVG